MKHFRLPSLFSTLWRKTKPTLDLDPEAAFPTAQWVAAMRAEDARSTKPLIGKNIGAGPDLIAAMLAGDVGVRLLRESSSGIQGVVNRTQCLDAHWMNAYDQGMTQFVILAAGLDARAWRMPRLHSSIKVFEVDVPRAHEYKTAKLAAFAASIPPCPCTRVPVVADLSQSGWTSALLAAGFVPNQPSFFMCEGLLYYLPPSAPASLFRSVESLMTPHSVLVGDTMINMLSFQPEFLAKWGTSFTFDLPSRDALRQLLASAGLPQVTVIDVLGINRTDDDAQIAHELGAHILHFESWPPSIVDFIAYTVNYWGDAGVQKMVAGVVDDKNNYHGLRDADAARKSRLVSMILGQPGFVNELRSRAAKVVTRRAGRSLWQRLNDTAATIRALSARGESGHVIFQAKK